MSYKPINNKSIQEETTEDLVRWLLNPNYECFSKWIDDIWKELTNVPEGINYTFVNKWVSTVHNCIREELKRRAQL